MNKRAMVLLSGGIDSTTCLHMAREEYGSDYVGALSVFYGQRHHREAVCAERTCRRLGIGFDIIDLSSIVPNTMLTDPNQDIPNKSYDDLDPGVSPTYVPFRNGLMLSAIISVFFGKMKNLGFISEGMGKECHTLYFGAHAEDAQNWAYADCTPEFIGAMANAIYIGTYGSIRLHTPLEWMNKADVIRKGHQLSVAWEDTWSCYKGGEVHCGVCPTCRSRRRGFVKAGVEDPTVYQYYI